jgi:hypothetical protein
MARASAYDPVDVPMGLARSQGRSRMKPDVYEHLYRVNAGFEQVLEGLKALRKCRPFDAGEVDRFWDLVQEARGATNSYLAGVVERAETKEAGRRFRDRLRREKAEEIGA